MQGFLITVAEGARQLGVSERTLRRVLREPELQAQLRSTNRQVRGRERAVIMIPPQLMTALQERFPAAQPKPPITIPLEANVGQQTGVTFTTGSLVSVYQRLVSEKTMLIEQQRDRICDLQRALEHERSRSKRTQLQALNGFSTDVSGKDVMISTSLAAELRRLFAEHRAQEALPLTFEEAVDAPTESSASSESDMTGLQIDSAALVRVYEWVLKEKDLLIDQQRQSISDLQSGLEHERDQSMRANLILDVSEPQTRKLLPNSNHPEPESPRPFWAAWFKPQA